DALVDGASGSERNAGARAKRAWGRRAPTAARSARTTGVRGRSPRSNGRSSMKAATLLEVARLETPPGEIVVAATAEGLCALGFANGRNPISSAVPCHRVIAADGTLCGYGGGLPRKRWLLDHEAKSLRRALAV